MKARNPLINGTKGTIDDMVYRQVQGETIVGKKPWTSNPATEAQTIARAQFTHDNSTWKTVSAVGRASYTRQAAVMLTKTGKPMTGKQLYVQIGGTLALMGGQAPEICPEKPQTLPAMPQPLYLSSFSTASQFVMLVHSDGLASPVICESIREVSAGIEVFKTSSFRVISVAPAFFSPSTPLQTAYANKFGKPFAGSQIAVRLTPITDAGYRGQPVIYSCFVAASQEEMEVELEERKAKALEKCPKLRLSAA